MEPAPLQPFRTAIVMSRLPQLIDPQSPWLAGLRACLLRVLNRQQRLLMASGTAGADFIRRGAFRLGIETQEVIPIPDGSIPGSRTHVLTSSAEAASLDQQLALLADELLVLGLRPRGNWHKFLTERLRSGRRGVVLVDRNELQPTRVRQELLDLGAVTWTPDEAANLPLDPGLAPVASEHRNDALCPFATTCTLFPVPARNEWTYLTHTTRECPGPWPEQDPGDYVDSVLDSRIDGLHSSLATLIRIVQQRRLIASNRTIRGGYPVVSLTAVPLEELTQLRCFRTHRYRWDFEPYGICVKRSTLLKAGARPVIYGTEQTWHSLSAEERPFFQLCGSTSNSATTGRLEAAREIDWSREREWRYRGNLDLSLLDKNDITVFVPTYADARQVFPYSPWPVTLWPTDVDHKC